VASLQELWEVTRVPPAQACVSKKEEVAAAKRCRQKSQQVMRLVVMNAT